MCSFELSHTTSGSITGKFLDHVNDCQLKGPTLHGGNTVLRYIAEVSPHHLCLDMAGWHACSNDPNSYTSNSIATGRSSLPGRLKERSQTKFDGPVTNQCKKIIC